MRTDTEAEAARLVRDRHDGDCSETYLVVGASSTVAVALSRARQTVLIGRAANASESKLVGPDILIGDLSSAASRAEACQEVANVVEGLASDQNLDSVHLVQLQGVSRSSWEECIAVNVESVVEIAEAFAAAVAAADSRGSIVLIGSASSRLGGKTPYAATKAAAQGIMSGLNKEHAPRVRTNVLVPGAFVGRMTADWSKSRRAEVSARTYLNRLATPEEIVHGVVFLCENGYMCGASLDMTCGQLR